MHVHSCITSFCKQLHVYRVSLNNHFHYHTTLLGTYLFGSIWSLWSIEYAFLQLCQSIVYAIVFKYLETGDQKNMHFCSCITSFWMQLYACHVLFQMSLFHHVIWMGMYLTCYIQSLKTIKYACSTAVSLRCVSFFVEVPRNRGAWSMQFYSTNVSFHSFIQL